MVDQRAQLAALSALASGLCQDVGITIEVGDSSWSWDPLRRVIHVAEQDLREHGPDYCAGVLGGEVGHFYLTRHDLFGVDFPSEQAARAVLDALEDARVNTWMAARYPGVRPWIAEVAEVVELPDPGLPSFLKFCHQISAEGWRDFLPLPQEYLPSDVFEALAATRPARMELARMIPPTTLRSAFRPEITRYYQEEIWPELLNPRWLPLPWEQMVQIKAWEALLLAEQEILPVARELLLYDLRAIEEHLSQLSPRQARERMAQLMRELMAKAEWADARELPPEALSRMTWARELSLEALEGMLRSSAPVRIITTSHAPFHGFDEPLSVELPELPPLELRGLPPTNYDHAYERVAAQVDALSAHLEELLIPRKRLRERVGYPSGSRVSLRRLMAFEADPKRYNELWARTTIPERRNVAFSLLIDLSGSMRGERIHSAILGTILMAETLARLDVNFAINGFQDVLIPFSAFGEPFTDATRKAISEMTGEVDGSRPGGHNEPSYNDDGPCLMEAADTLLREAASDRLLIVVSDGCPAGRRSTEADLHTAVGSLTAPGTRLELIALGLGPDTGHVSDFYPGRSLANVPLNSFADAIGRLIEETLVGALGLPRS